MDKMWGFFCLLYFFDPNDFFLLSVTPLPLQYPSPNHEPSSRFSNSSLQPTQRPAGTVKVATEWQPLVGDGHHPFSPRSELSASPTLSLSSSTIVAYYLRQFQTLTVRSLELASHCWWRRNNAMSRASCGPGLFSHPPLPAGNSKLKHGRAIDPYYA